MACRRRSLPVPVTLNRLAAPLSVFCFGICLYCLYLSGPVWSGPVWSGPVRSGLVRSAPFAASRRRASAPNRVTERTR